MRGSNYRIENWSKTKLKTWQQNKYKRKKNHELSSQMCRLQCANAYRRFKLIYFSLITSLNQRHEMKKLTGKEPKTTYGLTLEKQHWNKIRHYASELFNSSSTRLQLILMKNIIWQLSLNQTPSADPHTVHVCIFRIKLINIEMFVCDEESRNSMRMTASDSIAVRVARL